MTTSIWKKLVTAVRGGASEVGESIADANAIRILDQEIRDADNALVKARDGLITIKAKYKLSAQRLEEHATSIANWEGRAMQALNKGEEALAVECASKIAEIEALRDQEQELADQFGKQVSLLQEQVIKAESRIKSLKQQVEMAKPVKLSSAPALRRPLQPVARVVRSRLQWVRWRASSSARTNRMPSWKRPKNWPASPAAVTLSVVCRTPVLVPKAVAQKMCWHA